MSRKNLPLVISFMGVDGSGKTTLAKKLIKFFKNSKYLHLKPYILCKDRRTVVKEPYKQKMSSSSISLLRLFSWLVSYKVFFFRNKKKNLFIFDRYAHDIILDPLRYKHNLSNSLTKWILNIFPKPDLWIFLKPSIKTLKSRKFELSDEDLKKKLKKYSIFFTNKKNVLILNTNKQYKILITKILKRIDRIVK